MPICDGQELFVATSDRSIVADALLPKVNAGSVDSAAFRSLSLHAVAPPSAASRSTFPESMLRSDDTSVSRERSDSPDTILKQMSDSVQSSSLFTKTNLSDFPSEPDISDPGPDMGNYPNSDYTLRQGRIYVESAPFGYQTITQQNPAAYNFPFLLRYGLTDDVELRLAGNGLTSTDDFPNSKTSVAPLILDTKVRLLNEQMDVFIPAAALEVYLQTNWGSKEFRGGVQPSLNLNLNFPSTDVTNIEMTLGYTGVQAELELNQFSHRWAMEQQVTDPLEMFVHGYYLATVGSLDFSNVIGTGGFYKPSEQTILCTSFNAATDRNSPPFSTQFGIAFAF